MTLDELETGSVLEEVVNGTANSMLRKPSIQNFENFSFIFRGFFKI